MIKINNYPKVIKYWRYSLCCTLHLCFSFILYLVVCASYSPSPILPLPSLPLLTTSLFFIQEPQVWVKSLPNWRQKTITNVNLRESSSIYSFFPSTLPTRPAAGSTSGGGEGGGPRGTRGLRRPGEAGGWCGPGCCRLPGSVHVTRPRACRPAPSRSSGHRGGAGGGRLLLPHSDLSPLATLALGHGGGVGTVPVSGMALQVRPDSSPDP